MVVERKPGMERYLCGRKVALFNDLAVGQPRVVGENPPSIFSLTDCGHWTSFKQSEEAPRVLGRGSSTELHRSTCERPDRLKDCGFIVIPAGQESEVTKIVLRTGRHRRDSRPLEEVMCASQS